MDIHKIAEKENDYCTIREFCDWNDMLHFPMWVEIETKMKDGKPVLLSDGSSKKIKKHCISKKNPKPPKLGFSVFYKKNAEEICRRRWADNEKNPEDYNFIAYNTSNKRVFDIDCVPPAEVDGEPNPVIELLKSHPIKISATKSFGRHIFADKIFTLKKKHGALKLDKKYGVDLAGKAAIEYLHEFWGWSPINDKVYFPKKPLTSKSARQLQRELEKQHKKKKKVVQKKDTSTKTSISNDVSLTENAIPLDYTIIEENLMRYKPEHVADAQKAAGIILKCASTQDEKVYEIVHELMKRPNSNYSTEQWVRDIWNSYNASTHASYTIDDYLNPNEKKEFPWGEFMDDDDKMVQERFIANHSHNFIINTDYKREKTQLCYFDEKECLWKHDPKTGIGKSIIHQLLMKKEYIYWKKEMEASIESMDDYETDNEGKQQPNELKKLAKLHKKKHLKKYHSTGGWLNGTIKNIYTMLLYNPELRVKVQFNLMPNTKHLFQFRNKAFNFKTGKLEERTRDMYITNEAILDYDYPENESDDDYTDEMTFIDNMLKKILPNTTERQSICSFLGMCLTGEIIAQIFFIFLGPSAGNGKSTILEALRDAFPCYIKIIGKDAVIDNAKDDKCLSGLVNRAYRLLYVEELTEIGFKVKELTQKTTPVKPLYMEEIQLSIQFKFVGLCNAVAETKCDKGVLRRGRQQEFNSQFVNDADDVDEKNHIYLKDPSLGERFQEDTRYKIALFRYLAKYTKDYYDRGVNDWKKQFEGMREAFKDTNQDDNALAEFVKCFKKDKNIDSIISKTEMLELLYKETSDEYINVKYNNEGNVISKKYKKFTNVRNEFKKHRYKYESQLKNHLPGKSNQKGLFMNIKYIGNE